MKRATIAFLLVCFVLNPLMAEILVLTNGKKFECKSYEVKGQYVVITTKSGDLTQLPLKMVDLEKSKELTAKVQEQRKQKAEAARLAAQEAEKRRMLSQDASMADVAEFVERNRDPKQEVNRNLSIGNDDVDTYVAENPRVINKQAQANTMTSPGAEEYMAKRDEVSGQYHELKSKLDDIDRQIEQTQAHITQMQNISAYGLANVSTEEVDDDDLGYKDEDEGPSPAYAQMKTSEKKLETLKKERAKVEKQLKDVERQAKAADVKDFKRHKPKPKENEGGGGR